MEREKGELKEVEKPLSALLAWVWISPVVSSVNETIIYWSVYLKAEINELVESILLFLFLGLKQGDSTEGQHSRICPLRGSSATLGHRWVIYSAKLKCSCAGKFFLFSPWVLFRQWVCLTDNWWYNISNVKCQPKMWLSNMFYYNCKVFQILNYLKACKYLEEDQLVTTSLEAAITFCVAHGGNVVTTSQC